MVKILKFCMLLYGFVWFGRNSEAEVKTINEWKRLCGREWKRLCESKQSVSQWVSESVSKVGIELLGQLKSQGFCTLCIFHELSGLRSEPFCFLSIELFSMFLDNRKSAACWAWKRLSLPLLASWPKKSVTDRQTNSQYETAF